MSSGVQYFPQVIPPSTVLGRLSQGSGAVEAIPFGALSAGLGTFGVQSILLGTIAGTNTITGVSAAPSPAVSLLANQAVYFIPAVTNTGAATLNRDSLGAKNIFQSGAALVGGELQVGVPVLLFYDGTQYNVIGQLNFLQSGSGAIIRTLQGKLRDIVSVKDFGAKGDGVTDDTAAVQAAVNSLTSGGICYFPIGTYKLTSTVTIAVNGILLLGSRANGSVISFVPSVAGAAFSFTAGASILSYCGIEGFQFTSTDTTTAKDMVRVSDVSYFEARKLVAIDNAWKGGTSVGFRLRGREEIRIRDCQIYTDKPIVVETNPNNATTMLDHSSAETSSLIVTSALTNPCVDFTGSGNVTNIAFKRVAFVRGAGAIKCNLTSATASQVFEIENCRSEQTAGTTQNSLDFSESGGSNIQGLSVKNFTFDPNLNGIKLRNCLYVNLQDILLTSSTKTNLDVDSTVDYLNLHNFFSQSGGTISGLANVKDLTRIGYVTGSNASLNSVQRLIADAITTAPTIPAGFTGLGASGTVTVDAGSSDLAGSITLSPAGAGIAGVGNLTLTFNAGYTNAPIVVANGAVGSASWADAPVMQVQPSGASCLIRWMNGPTPTNLTSGQTYKITYVVLGK